MNRRALLPAWFIINSMDLLVVADSRLLLRIRDEVNLFRQPRASLTVGMVAILQQDKAGIL